MNTTTLSYTIKEVFRKLIKKSLIYLGLHPVYVSTQQNGTNDNDNFQFTVGNETLLLHGVLCENGQ